MSINERFWAKVDKSGDCWLWTGCKDRDGYGFFWFERKLVRATQVAFFLTHGCWPKPMCLHTCDNPPCVRPDHLYAGTAKQNTRDAVNRGRLKGRVLISEMTVRAIRGSVGKHSDIAKQYGVSKAQVGNILRRDQRKGVS